MKDQSGQVLIVSVVFLFIFLLMSATFSNNLIFNLKTVKVVKNSMSAQNIAESGIEKALWCLNQTVGTNCQGTFGDNFTGETNVALNNGIYTTTLQAIGLDKIKITSTAYSNDNPSNIKIAEVTINKVVNNIEYGQSFNFAVNAGVGGILAYNNAYIIGDVYANGSVTCSSNNITGNVSVASSGHEIYNCNVSKNAYAHEIENSTIQKDAYYQILKNTTVNGVKHSGSTPPAPITFPILDPEFDEFKASSQLGETINGNLTINSSTKILGPAYINGNLVVANNSTLELTGVVYVAGNIEIYNNSIVKLNSNFADYSAMLIGEGRISIYNNVIFQIASQGSFVFVASRDTSNTVASITLSNNSNSAIFYAPYGYIYLSNNANLSSIFANKIVMNNNSSINYNPLLANFKVKLDVYSQNGYQLKKGSWNLK